MKTPVRYPLFICVLLASLGLAQSQNFSERLLLDFPVIDAPYLHHAAQMAHRKHHNLPASEPLQATWADYFRSLESPSMAQSLAMTKNLHATNYYFNNVFWNKKIAPTTRKKKFLNRLAANGTAAGIDLLLAYKLMVFSPVWNHEEFHRNGLTMRGISSFDDTYYRLVGGDIPSGSVTRVRDEDLAYFKATDPVGLVRTFAAGIESQLMLVRNMQKDNFFSDTDYANIAMNILITKQAADYVNQFRKQHYDRSIDTMNYYGKVVDARDFAGWDFTPWVYDMFRPNEPYEARGTHPNGIGIDRAIKRSKLTAEEDAYLTRMGQLQYLNFLSPFMVGIHAIRLNDNGRFNFAMRHYLTSFGYNLNADFFINHRGKNMLIGLHTFHNKNRTYPGLEVEQQFLKLNLLNKVIPLHSRAMVWVQPDNESFYATNGKAGGLVQFRVYYPVSKQFSAYAEAEAKSSGWVAGNPFLKPNMSMRAGLFFDITRN
ncbi:MAG: hypothetical protein ACOYXA_19445 [Bacteroidota bacterium]